MTDEAWLAAERAADHAGVRVRTLDDPNDLPTAVRIFDQVWPLDSGGTNVMANLLRALVHSGGYASVAVDTQTGQAVGAALAVVGRHRETPGDHDSPWHTHLHSHMAGVLEEHRNRSIGTAIKLHQRAWSLDMDIDTIMWSFDPLVRRNAWLNLHKLGTQVRGYEPNFYGDMDDAINAGDPSDRVFAWWSLDGESARAAARSPLPVIEPDADDDARRIPTPEDIVALRRRSPHEALEWRLRVRADFLAAFEEGFEVIGIDAGGSYVLRRRIQS